MSAACLSLTKLVVIAPHTDAALHALATCAERIRTETLELCRAPVSAHTVAPLAAFAGLCEVSLVCVRLTVPALSALLGAAGRAHWTGLALRMTGLTAEHVVATAPLWVLGRLERLQVHGNPLGPDGCAVLLRAVAPSGALRVVHITYCVNAGDGAGADANAAAAATVQLVSTNPHLSHLDLSGSIQGDAWVRGVAGSGAGALGSLQELALSATDLSSVAFGALLRLAPPSLRALCLAHNAIRDPPPLSPAPALIELDLAGNGLDAAALGALRLSALAGSLCTLHLGMNKLGSTSASFELQEQARGCPRLVFLNLECNDLDDGAVFALRDALADPRQVCVLLGGNDLTNACWAGLPSPHRFELWVGCRSMCPPPW